METSTLRTRKVSYALKSEPLIPLRKRQISQSDDSLSSALDSEGHNSPSIKRIKVSHSSIDNSAPFYYDDFLTVDSVITFIEDKLCSLDNSILDSLVQSNPLYHNYPASSSIIVEEEKDQQLLETSPQTDWIGSKITYRQLLQHILSLRTEYIIKFTRPILLKLYTSSKNVQQLFNTPVDYIKLNLYRYLEIVKTPMDLGTIKNRLQSGYYRSFESIFRDMRLVFENAINFNGKDHQVGKLASELLKELESEITIIEDKFSKDAEKKNSHNCDFCAGSLCLLCGEKCLKYESSVLICSGSSCNQRIKKHSIYFVAPDGSNLWCQKCYMNLPSSIPIPHSYTSSNSISTSVSFNDIPQVSNNISTDIENTTTSSNSILHPDMDREVSISHDVSEICPPQKYMSKKLLLKCKFNEEISEGWVDCDLCSRWYHSVCALYINQDIKKRRESNQEEKFYCPLCILSNIPSNSNNTAQVSPSYTVSSQSNSFENIPAIISENDSPSNQSKSNKVFFPQNSKHIESITISQLFASSLPKTKLSDYLESVISDLLNSLGEEKVLDSICIRVTSDSIKFLEVPQQIRQHIPSHEGYFIEDKIPYRQKCITMFQNIDGIDVCIFCLYVQEFDSHAPSPNTNTCYIAYLDSVNFFRPVHLRTLIYQEIVTGYMVWAQARGYKTCHIWACPPQRGDNFIFWCHPSHQKTPSRDRLNLWYNTLLLRCQYLNVHSEIEHLFQVSFSKYFKREEGTPREAARRSYVGSGQHNEKSRNRKSKGAIMKQTSSSLSINTEDSNSPTPLPTPQLTPMNSTDINMENNIIKDEPIICPPIFEGHFWIQEFHRLLHTYGNKNRLLNESQSSLPYRKCLHLMKNLISKPFSLAFRQPVDPVLLDIPTYFDIIKEPMDLGTIRENLRSFLYDSVYEFSRDVRLTFNNAILFNPDTHSVNINARNLLNEFEKQIEDIVIEFNPSYSVLRSLNESENREILDQCMKEIKLVNSRSRSSTFSNENTPLLSSSNFSSGSVSHQTFDFHLTGNQSRRSSIGDFHSVSEMNTPSYTITDEFPQPIVDSCKKKFPRFEGDESYFMEETITPPHATPRCSIDGSFESDSLLENFASPSVLNHSISLPVDPPVDPIYSISDLESYSCGFLHFKQSDFSSKMIPSLYSDLAKAIHRMNEDLFVISFNPFSPSLISSENVQSPLGTSKFKSKNIIKTKFSANTISMLNSIHSLKSDPDPLIHSPLMNSRYQFLEMCQFRHFQFDSLRRAKYSSLCLLFYLSNPSLADRYCRPHCSCCYRFIGSTSSGGGGVSALRCLQRDDIPEVDLCLECFQRKSLEKFNRSSTLLPNSLS